MTLSDDEVQVLDAYRRVKERRFGDLEVSVSKGRLVKLFEIIKNSVVQYPLSEMNHPSVENIGKLTGT
jgi:hypothetical protein